MDEVDFDTGKFLKGTGTILKLFQNLRAGDVAEEAGLARQRAKFFTAKSLRKKAGAERATGQRLAADEVRKEKLVQSRLQAVAAGSGAGGPGIETLASRIAAEGDFRKRVALFGAEETARGLEDLANLKTFEGIETARAGRIRKGASRTAAAATLLEFFEDLSLFDKFGEDEDEDDTKISLA